MVSAFAGPPVLKIIYPDQFGAITRSSMVQALTSMLHHWTRAIDGTESGVRVVLFDYRKAFDYIDHQLLTRKIYSLDIPRGGGGRGVVRWMVDLLSHRYQRVKLSADFFSGCMELRTCWHTSGDKIVALPLPTHVKRSKSSLTRYNEDFVTLRCRASPG